MPNTEWNQLSRRDAAADAAGAPEAGCQAGDLKGLLNTIVTQIAEADRRQSDALGQMQDRLAALGQDAKSLRSRVPGQFQLAFERIEAGMAELAERIAEAGAGPAHAFSPAIDAHSSNSMSGDVSEPAVAPPSGAGNASAAPQSAASHGEHTFAHHNHTDEPPVALRSAQTPAQQNWRREEASLKPAQTVDTFDVIESLPGDVTDPWDRDAANALAHVYDGEGQTFPQESYGAALASHEPQPLSEPSRIYSTAPQAAPAAVDQSWLEKRFADISDRIETSLAEIRPDQSFFALGQRLDQFERSFAQAFDNVATHNDLDSVRQIETHMAELVGHLENTHNHLARIETIEDQMSQIASRLDEIHALASGAGEQQVDAADDAARAPQFDVAAVAKAAADEAAARFVMQVPPAPVVPGLDEMRHLMERSMSDARQSEENTSALLDTLQQAMIRMLDRMDAIEFNQHQAAETMARSVVQAPVAAQPAYGADDRREAKTYAAPAKHYPGGDKPYGSDQPFAASDEEQFSRHEPRFENSPTSATAPREEGAAALDAAVASVAAGKASPVSAYRQYAAAQRGTEAATAGTLSEMRPEMRQDMRPDTRPGAPTAAASPEAANETRQPDKLRQDFIADARRAKMRLANEADGAGVVIANPAAREGVAGPAKPAPAGKPAKAAVAAAAAADKKASAISPRVVALTLALLAAGGAYMMLPLGKGSRQQAAVTEPAAVTDAKKPELAASDAKKAAPKAADAGSADNAGASDAPPPDADFSKPATAPSQMNLHQTEGHIVSDDITVGAIPGTTATVAMHGVSVATDTSADAKDVARARRDSALASVSNRLGIAAGEGIPQASPAALIASTVSPAETAALTPGKGAGSALDLPPATVGPLSLRLAAANGDPSAEFEVGARLAEGKGTDQNFKDAAKWYQRAASKGFVQAQYRLGTLYERGLGMKADEERAKDWYVRAAEQGNIKAMHNLAVLSANGRASAPDYATAAKWFTDAAERGLADSQFNLAVLYENGLGVEADVRQSYKWLALAARGGDKEAVRRRDIMKGKLTAEDIAAAEGMVKSFQVRASDPLSNDARTAGEAWKKNPANGDNG